MVIDSAGWPFVGGALALAVVMGWWLGWWGVVTGVLLAVAFLFFFRDPERRMTAPANAVVSPADGRVMVAGPPIGQELPPGKWQQISIFLSPMDVHVNRMPVSGRVT